MFGTRFLVVGVPFHSQYFRDAADKVISQDLNGEELWTAEGPRILSSTEYFVFASFNTIFSL